ncbi:MAG: hypothetical protein ABSB70_24600 [Candidatus Velthaea sp.]|jgi:hypothetical protein
MANATEDRNDEREQNPMTTTGATKIAPGPRFGEVCEDLIVQYDQHAEGGCECQELEKDQFSSMLDEYVRGDRTAIHVDDRRHAAIGFAIRRSEHYLESAPSGAPNWEAGELVAHRLGYDEAGVARLRLQLETLKPLYDGSEPEHSAKVAALDARQAKMRAPLDSLQGKGAIRNIYRGSREDNEGHLSVGILEEKEGSCGRIVVETEDGCLILDSGEVLDVIAALVVARKAIDENVVRVSSGH